MSRSNQPIEFTSYYPCTKKYTYIAEKKSSNKNYNSFRFQLKTKEEERQIGKFSTKKNLTQSKSENSCLMTSSSKANSEHKPIQMRNKQKLSKNPSTATLESLRNQYLIKELEDKIGTPIRTEYKQQSRYSKSYKKTVETLENELNFSQDELVKVNKSKNTLNKESTQQSYIYQRLLIENSSLKKSITEVRKEREHFYKEINRLNKETVQMGNETREIAFSIDKMKMKQKTLLNLIEEIKHETKLIRTAWMIVMKRRDELSQGRAQLAKKNTAPVSADVSFIMKAFK